MGDPYMGLDLVVRIIGSMLFPICSGCLVNRVFPVRKAAMVNSLMHFCYHLTC